MRYARFASIIAREIATTASASYHARPGRKRGVQYVADCCLPGIVAKTGVRGELPRQKSGPTCGRRQVSAHAREPHRRTVDKNRERAAVTHNAAAHRRETRRRRASIPKKDRAASYNNETTGLPRVTRSIREEARYPANETAPRRGGSTEVVRCRGASRGIRCSIEPARARQPLCRVEKG